MVTSSTPHSPPHSQARRLIDTKEVGRLLGCSWRTVLRHADAGHIPWGIKLGSLRRWHAVEIESFIANGCRMSNQRAASRPQEPR
jgi:predicted DNA-binding transcriptional regulator AlpA